MPARWRTSSASTRCSCQRRPACSPRSASWRATSVATPSARTSGRSARSPSCPATGRPTSATAASRSSSRFPLGGDVAETFHRAHEERYGYADRDRPVELVAVRTAEIRPGPAIELPPGPTRSSSWARRSLALDGATCWIPPGWVGDRDGDSTLILTTIVNIQLQVIGSALRAVAEEMGAALIRSGVLVEHQGAARLLDRALRRAWAHDRPGRAHPRSPRRDARGGRGRHGPAIPRPGEIFAVNDPFTGGTHLPDITLVSRTEVGFAVSRAHHADVGGMEPSSLPAGSRELYQEGVIIPPVRLDDDVLRLSPRQHAQPRRAPWATCGRRSRPSGSASDASWSSANATARATVESAMDELYALLGASCPSRRSRRCPTGGYEAADVLEPLEGELEIRVAVTIAGDEIDDRLRRDVSRSTRAT